MRWSFYKIGMELLASGDYFTVLDELARRDKRIFVDLKFFDIPATVAGVIRGLSRWPVTFCTIHGWHAGMMQAAAEAREGELRLLAVTVLTSMDGNDLKQLGISGETADIVVERAWAAKTCGHRWRDRLGTGSRPDPGGLRIRLSPSSAPASAPAGRSATTRNARWAWPRPSARGADAIVVGRPISLGRRSARRRRSDSA